MQSLMLQLILFTTSGPQDVSMGLLELLGTQQLNWNKGKWEVETILGPTKRSKRNQTQFTYQSKLIKM